MILRKGAEGNLPLPPVEKIEIIAVLATGHESELRAKARATLRDWDRTEVRQALASLHTAPEVFYVAAEELLPNCEDLKEALLGNRSLPDEIRNRLQLSTASLRATEESNPNLLAKLTAALEQGDTDVVNVLPPEIESPPEVSKLEELTGVERQTLLQKIGRMSAVERIKAALTGNLETRMILVRDANKVVARAVLQSPKLSETELESYAAAKNVSEEVLRLIAINRKFMKAYVVLRALVNNPRAPIDLTLPLIKHLKDRDLKGVSLNRNVPEVIRSMAVKLVKLKEEALKPKLPGRH